MPNVGLGELVVVALVVGVFLAQVAIGVLLWRWGTRVADKHGTRAWRLASWMPVGWIALNVLGCCVPVVFLIPVFGSVAAVGPEEKAAALGEGIASAMNLGVPFGAVGFLLLVASVVSFAIGSIRNPSNSTPSQTTRPSVP